MQPDPRQMPLFGKSVSADCLMLLLDNTLKKELYYDYRRHCDKRSALLVQLLFKENRHLPGWRFLLSYLDRFRKKALVFPELFIISSCMRLADMVE